jgi:group I intron endonuclease
MKSKISGIYCITSKINNKKYVGQSVNIGQRWISHLNTLKLNKHRNKYLQNHFNKYSVEDLTFEVLEEVVDLTLLTSREQYYMDLLKPEFNHCPAASSSLGYKKAGSRYYSYNVKEQTYRTSYSIAGKVVKFNYYYTLEETLKEVEYLKTLTNDELLKYKEKCLDKPKKRCKGYYLDKKNNRFIVKIKTNNKNKYYGQFVTEQEAIDRVKQVKLELGIS